MGRGNRKRKQSSVEGVLLVDKPEGPTSFDIVAKARRALNTRSIGHTGTLDPMASGLLVLLIGRYTRLSAHLVSDDKIYAAQVKFGARTNTDDAEGEVVEEGDANALTEEGVREAIAKMVGPARQVPPIFSAISVGGERLYKKARRGEEVEVPARDVEFYSLEVTAYDASDAAAPTVDVTVACSKGTYIRAFARDLGVALGVPAHLSGLRRIKSGAYSLQGAVTLEELEAQGAEAVATGASVVEGIAKIEVGDEERLAFDQGRSVTSVDVTALKEGELALAHQADAPLALVTRKGPTLVVTRGFGPPPAAAETADEAAQEG